MHCDRVQDKSVYLTTGAASLMSFK